MKTNKVIIPDNLNNKDYQKPELLNLNEIKETLATCVAGTAPGAGELCFAGATAGTLCQAGTTNTVGLCNAGTTVN